MRLTTSDGAPGRLSLWRELAIAAAVSVAVAVVAGAFDVLEVLYAWSRRWERLQLDELPLALTTFTACLLLLYARRYRQARAALAARHAAEAALERAYGENRALAREHLSQQEAERKHLARELHDELGQYLNAIKIDAVAVGAGTLSAEQQVVAGRRLVASADHVHAAVSDMIRRLRPVGLDELGLGAALEHCIDQWRQRLPAVQFGFVREGELDRLGESVDLAVYRVVQEAVTNAGRHAAAKRVDVRVARGGNPSTEGDCVEITIVDDGAGIDPERPHRGFGLAGMRERVELLGGELAIRSAPGEGTRLHVSLPVRGGAR